MDLLSSNPEILSLTVKAAQAQQAESVPATEERLATRKRDLEAVTAEAEAVLGSLAGFQDGKGVEFIRPRMAALSDRKATLEEEIARQDAALERAKAASFNAVEIQLLLRNARAALEGLPLHQRKELVGLIIRKATISPQRLVFDMLGGQQWVAKLNAALALVGTPGRPKKYGPSKMFGWPVLWLTKRDNSEIILRS